MNREDKGHWRFTDEVFVTTFESLEMPPSFFNHEAHLRLAFLYIHRYDINPAIRRMQHHLRRFTQKIGQEDKFDAELTLKSMLMMEDFPC